MVRIRLRRVGAKNQPSFRIVAADKESPRDGRFLENLGHYNPRTEPATVQVDEARLFHWLRHGAQPSNSVRKILKPLGTWDRWERFKAGEDLDTLLEEAKESFARVDPRTRRDDLIGKRPLKKAAKEKKQPAEKAPAEEEPAPEEPEIEEPTEEEPPTEAVEEDIAEPEAEAEEEVEPEAEEAETEETTEESSEEEEEPSEEPSEETSEEEEAPEESSEETSEEEEAPEEDDENASEENEEEEQEKS